MQRNGLARGFSNLFEEDRARVPSMMEYQNAKFVEFWQKMTLVTAATRKILYTPPGAWHGKYFGMAWP
ncbi:MAG: hypothetical protein II206_04020 [Bacteroidaceae bacterium]|nr:hypothetical protein [Bacteroidaceae bacterium]